MHEPPRAQDGWRPLAEAITQDIAARLGVRLQQPTQAELLRAVDARIGLDAQVRELFHLLRRTGNLAAHEAGYHVTHREGMDALRVACELAIWFHRSFGSDPDFRPGPFTLPHDPQALAEEAEQRTVQLRTAFDAQLQSAHREASAGDQQRFAQRAAQAARGVLPDGAATRRLIDAQLAGAGWQADSQRLTYASGSDRTGQPSVEPQRMTDTDTDTEPTRQPIGRTALIPGACCGPCRSAARARMGNRGILHLGQHLVRPWAHKAWVHCVLDATFQKRRPFSLPAGAMFTQAARAWLLWPPAGAGQGRAPACLPALLSMPPTCSVLGRRTSTRKRTNACGSLCGPVF